MNMNVKTIRAMKIFKWIGCVLAALMALAACSDDDDNGTARPDADVTTLNVDIILPRDIYAQYKNTIDWQLANALKAQQTLDRQVRLNVRYHDEDTEDLDHLGYTLSHPEDGDADTCSAIIGPYYDEHARHILNYAVAKRLPVLLPTCTSGELQRINARSTNAWFLTESDITQCEVLLSAVRAQGKKNVALIYADDEYGETYRNWFGFLATEYKLNVVRNGIIKYKGDTNISSFLNETHKLDDNTYVLLAVSNQDDYVRILNQIGKPEEQTGNSFIIPMCTSSAMADRIVATGKYMMGVSPVASPTSGFISTYEARFGKEPTTGEAQVYDALSIITLGAVKRLYAASPGEKALTDWMRDVVAYKQGEGAQWTADGLASVVRAYSQRGDIAVNGATGQLLFDQATHTKILQTCYQLWAAEDGKKGVVGYLSTSGSNNSASTTSVWEWQQTVADDFDPNIKVDHNLPACTDHWAVLISPSTSWANYRHQADVFAMYQLLKKHGYDDDHIIVIVEDNLAGSKENAERAGKIFVEVNGEDVHRDVKVDYHFSDLQPQDVADIMLGRQSERLPAVLHTTKSSDVLFFWSGHGGDYDGPLWGQEDATVYFGSERIKQIAQQMHEQGKYRRMMFAIETCFSGIWGNALTGIPDVIAITAANEYEPSKADVQDRDLGVFLSNAFARSFRDAINGNPSISVRDLYLNLAKTTTGSHVSLYNERNYGSVYTCNMADYMK